MKISQALVLFVVIVLAATIANLIALKIAADQIGSSVSSSPLLGIFGKKT